MSRDTKNGRKHRPSASAGQPKAMIVIAGTVTCTPAQLVNPLPSDTLRIGIPIMPSGFVTMTGLLTPPGSKSLAALTP